MSSPGAQGVYDSRDEAPKLHGGREIALVVDGSVGCVGLYEEHTLPIVVDLNPPTFISRKPPCHQERHGRLHERVLHSSSPLTCKFANAISSSTIQNSASCLDV